MNNSYEHIDLVESYVRGTLEGKKLSDFVEELARNSELQQQVAREQSIYDVLLDADALNLKDMISNDLNKPSRSTSNNNSKKIIKGLAGVAVLAVTTFLFWDNSKEERKDKTVVITEEVINKQEEKATPAIKEKVSIQENNHNIKSNNTPTKIDNKEKETSSLMLSNNEKETIESDSLIVENTKEGIVLGNDNIEPVTTKATSETENNTAPPVIKEVDLCKGVKFTGTVETKVSVKGESNGKILLSQSTIIGGEAPYSFDLIKNGDFYETEEFTSLESGEYIVYIKDANGCEGRLNQSVKIMSTLCKNNYISTFEISREDNWVLPINEYEDREVHVTLINKVGQQFVNRTIEIGDDMKWDGYFDDGSRVEMGSYRWIIKYSSGEICKAKMQVQN